MTFDDFFLALIVVAFAVFGVTLFSVSLYTWLPRKPHTHAVTRATRPNASDEPTGANRRAF